MLTTIAIGRRSFRRAPQWLALLAMMIQFVASYGHIHPEDFRPMLQGHGAPAITAPNGTGSGLGDGLAPDTDCPVCASMAMLGSSALPAGIRLPVPSLHATTALVAFDALHLTTPPHLLFDTRGPPRA
ncbi:MAG TPA: hypothetical protein VHX19_08245 [Stellaceae bacterium]|jgi:hypothetical protein|nr:hypothetical protein [Stellaceae bacterium]